MTEPTPLSPTADEWHGDHPYLRNQINLILDEYKNPGAAVVAIHGDDATPIFSMYSGMASNAPGDRRRVDENTIFLIASVSKLATVVTLLRLAEELGLIGDDRRGDSSGESERRFPDTYIDQYLPDDFRICNPQAPDHRITFAELMDHTSGIVDNNEDVFNCVYTLNADSPVSVEQFCRDYLLPSHPPVPAPCNRHRPYHSEKNFGPPGQFSYSNAAYNLLGYLIELMLPKDWHGRKMYEYSQETVLKPLGFKWGGDVDGDEMKYAGAWMFSQLDQSQMARPGGIRPYFSFPGYPSGGIRCTGLALGRFLAMLMNEGTLVDPKTKEKVQILKRETMRRITHFTDRWTPWRTLYSYGFGFRTDFVSPFTDEDDNPPPRLVIGHTGGELDISTTLFWINDPNVTNSVGVLVLTNTGWNPKNAPKDISIAVFDYFRNLQYREVPAS